jgi:hypothetical protein
MEMLDDKTDAELIRSLTAEIAKATNELGCLKRDQQKVASRLSFCLLVLNHLIDRKGD